MDYDVLGGTFSKEVHIKGLSEFLPTYQVQQGAFDLAIFDATIGQILLS